jgi:hypothetical protein
LQALVDDELSIRARKRIADRFQRAALISLAAALASLTILGLISTDLNPKQSLFPTSGDTAILLISLALTLAIVIWNGFGWWGARETVRFTQLNWLLAAAALLFGLDAFAGAVDLYSWSTGAKVPSGWAAAAAWGALASGLLPVLVMLRIAIRAGFLFDHFLIAISERGLALGGRISWYVFVLSGTAGFFSAVVILINLSTQDLPVHSPELNTAIFAIPYVTSWLSLMASIPVDREARRRGRNVRSSAS